jgi:hypothetical protein
MENTNTARIKTIPLLLIAKQFVFISIALPGVVDSMKLFGF